MNTSIFEKINNLLMEAENNSSNNKDIKNSLPIHPEMETKDQGKQAAAEKILKLFQRLKAGGGGGDPKVNNNRPEIPDDLIDPLFKNPPKSKKDKEFDKNKLVGWDVEEEEQFRKEIEVDDDDQKDDDDFDDFDWRDNQFGDDDDEENMNSDDSKSEDEKLKDAINEILDRLDDEKQNGDGDDSGADWGDDENDEGFDGNDNQSARKNRLAGMKKALDEKDAKSFNDNAEELKKISNTSNDDNVNPGKQMEAPSNKTVEIELRKSGLDDKSIERAIENKNIDPKDEYSEEEWDELEKNVIDGLERHCKEKGKSALANQIVTTSSKRKINNDEWKEMLKIFLDKKSLKLGKTSNRNDEITFNNKNSLWRKAALPTMSAPSTGAIQTINCFIDFSGSVNKDLVFHFLGEVINLCVKLNYTDVNVYGFSDDLSVPRKISKKKIMEDVDNLKDGIELAIAETWKFLDTQQLGTCEEFYNVAEEINKIKQKEKDAVFLIFGDCLWSSIKNLKDNINRNKYLRDVCILVYFTDVPDPMFLETLRKIKDYVGIEHVITSKAQSIINYKK